MVVSTRLPSLLKMEVIVAQQCVSMGQSLNLLSSILAILLTCPNNNTLLCYSNEPFLTVLRFNKSQLPSYFTSVHTGHPSPCIQHAGLDWSTEAIFSRAMAGWLSVCHPHHSDSPRVGGSETVWLWTCPETENAAALGEERSTPHIQRDMALGV